MKLYTEEQVIRAMSIAVYYKHETYMEVLDLLKPIELPSDEEINETAWIKTTGEMRQYGYDIRKSFSLGAKWMINKILNNA